MAVGLAGRQDGGMRHRRSFLLVLLAGVTACSSSGSGRAGTATTTTVATTVTPTTAALRQVSAVIAEYRGQLRDRLNDRADCAATADAAFLTEGPVSLELLADKIGCQTSLIRATTPALLLARDFAKIKPPAEVRALTQETLTAAREMRIEADAYRKCLGLARTNDAIFSCTLVPIFESKADTLLTKLDAWDAYIGV